MLDSGASPNVMSLKVMEQHGLKTTRPYGNVCGIDSKRVKVYGLCENVEVILIDFPHISLLMNIIVIDVSDAWGCFYREVGLLPLGVSLAWTSPMHTFPWEMALLRYYIVESESTSI
jgi:hypothetical protein